MLFAVNNGMQPLF